MADIPIIDDANDDGKPSESDDNEVHLSRFEDASMTEALQRKATNSQPS